MVGSCRLLGVKILCSHSCPVGQVDVPVNLQPDMSFSVLQLFVSVWREECYTLKGQSLENGLPCIFHARGSILIAKVIEHKD